MYKNRVKELRETRKWSQAELAQRAGISRTGVSAIEGGRLVPSVATALTLAQSLHTTVEDLFGMNESHGDSKFEWAWKPAVARARYWSATVGGKGWLYPVEHDIYVTQRHDGVIAQSGMLFHAPEQAGRTLVIACCDPAVHLLAQEYEHQSGFRMIVLNRSSGHAMELLEQGIVHVAGVHWAASGDRGGNAGALQLRGIKTDLELMHVANWEDGLAVRTDAQIRSIRQVAKSQLRWIGRVPGAAARHCQDQVLGDRKAPTKVAKDHRGVVEAIRSGWADVGVCVRLASEEGRLKFISVSKESYDLCYEKSFADDPRLIALRAVVQSHSYRGTLMDLPGYDPAACGELQFVSASPKRKR